jgi:hypothetical protein
MTDRYDDLAEPVDPARAEALRRQLHIRLSGASTVTSDVSAQERTSRLVVLDPMELPAFDEEAPIGEAFSEAFTVAGSGLIAIRRRRALSTAAAIVLVAGAVGIAAAGDSPDTVIGTPPRNAGSSTSPAMPTSSTTGHATPLPPTIGSTTTIDAIVPPGPDQALAESILLLGSEHRPLWTDGPGTIELDAEAAAEIAGCAPYVDTVFESPGRPAAVAATTLSEPFSGFGDPYPPGFRASQYVVVFPTEALAGAMYDALRDPVFVDECLSAYVELIAPGGIVKKGGFAGTAGAGWVPFVGTPVEAPSVGRFGDESTVGAYERSWKLIWEEEIVGPDLLYTATVRVGRVVTIVDAMIVSGWDGVVSDAEEFARLVETVVDKTKAELDLDLDLGS